MEAKVILIIPKLSKSTGSIEVTQASIMLNWQQKVEKKLSTHKLNVHLYNENSETTQKMKNMTHKQSHLFLNTLHEQIIISTAASE